MIELRQVTKAFDTVQALDGVNMHVPAGSIYGLVGPNGAGKSTVLRHISGVYRQDAGQVLVGGEAVYENVKAKSRLAEIPDDIYFFVSASTKDMMHFYRGFYPKFDMQRYEQLKAVFANVDENRPIRRLSKGMRKQSAFWLALCCRPEVLLLDEPVDGLDPVMRRQVWSLLMEDVSQEGTTVLLSSHNLRELEDVCDYVGILSRGRILQERSLAQLQGGVVKLQMAFADGQEAVIPPELVVLHESSMGRVRTLVVRGTAQAAIEAMAPSKPLLLEALPLTLEEIFIYEMGGEGYEIREMVL